MYEVKVLFIYNLAMKKITSVILDLDQTLTIDQASWLQFTDLLGADFNIHQNIYNRFRDGQIGYESAKKELIGLWKSSSPLDRESIRDIFNRIELRPGAFDAIQYLRSKYNTCIISGAIDVFVELISEKLGVRDYYASTKFLFSEENILVDFEYKLSRGEEKLIFLKNYLSKYEISSHECCAIGDGDSDMPIFEEVGFPILYIATETTEENKKKIKTHLNSWNDITKVL